MMANLTTEQRSVVDRLVSSHIECGTFYGREKRYCIIVSRISDVEHSINGALIEKYQLEVFM